MEHSVNRHHHFFLGYSYGKSSAKVSQVRHREAIIRFPHNGCMVVDSLNPEKTHQIVNAFTFWSTAEAVKSSHDYHHLS